MARVSGQDDREKKAIQKENSGNMQTDTLENAPEYWVSTCMCEEMTRGYGENHLKEVEQCMSGNHKRLGAASSYQPNQKISTFMEH